ncbi:MAG: RodZ domain-containing protein [Sphingorhabdus sp.]
MVPLLGICPQEVVGERVVEIGVGEDSPSSDEFRFHSVGEQLKAERERQHMSLSDLAAKTRVPVRHLEAIEKSDFGALPGTTYTLGFARSFARALEMDAAKVSSELRTELALGGHDGYQIPTPNFEPTDPSRVPSRTLAWTAAIIGALVVGAYLLWRSMALNVGVEAVAPIRSTQKATASISSKSSLATGGEVALIATDTVWVKVYDADNKRLYENEMKAGEKFVVPADANRPMIVTGRPQVLQVTVGGKQVATLGEADKTVADVELTASSLLARKPAAERLPANRAEPGQPSKAGT